MDTGAWAEREFGGAALGDARRTRRLVRVAEAAARRPAGRLTEVFEVAAERAGAYRLVENDDVDPEVVAEAMYAAAVERSQGESFVFVAEDQSSLAFTDTAARKGTGSIGTRDRGARGFEVMTALAVSPSGVPLGVAGQRWWARTGEAAGDPARREPGEKESRFWPEVLEAVHSRFGGGGAARPWFQMDRGADDWQVWKKASELGAWVTVRACHDRRLVVRRAQPREYLFPVMAGAPEAGRYRLRVAAGPGRAARVAEMVVRFREVRPRMVEAPSKRTYKPTLWGVLAEEEGTTPPGEKPLRWLLLTTRPVASFADARLVVLGYSMRWRVELFHRAWKTGDTRVEDSQLRDERAIRLWATVLAAVATRLLRVTYLARDTPAAAATEEFSDEELEAIMLVSRDGRAGRGLISIAEATMMIARIGGYTGKSSGGPPGFVVLARGWERVEPALVAIRNLRRAGYLNKRSDEW